MPTRQDRVDLIRALEAARGGTKVITYLTSTRQQLESQMAMDAIPVIYEHLRTIATPKADTSIDLFLHTNGGDGIVPWRLVPLLREHCSELNVLVPHRAFSAGTLTALGADSVLMHRMGSLGPTDPTVANEFNPENPRDKNQLLGISVEDVSSFINLVKEDVGIRHEDELVQAFSILARKVHPLALGNVKRATAQSRMMGEKLLRQRAATALDEHEATELIESLTSQLYFHGHPINRAEAQGELRLPFVQNAEDDVEDAMWALYEAYAGDMRLDEPFLPVQEAYAQQPLAIPNAPQIVPTPQGLQPVPTTPTIANVTLPTVLSAYIESDARTDVHEVVYEVTLRREWTGEVNGNVFPARLGWTTDTTPVAATPAAQAPVVVPNQPKQPEGQEQ